MNFPPSRPQNILTQYLMAALAIGLATLLFRWLRDTLTLANFAVLYLLVTLVMAIWLGTGPSLLTATMSFFCFNFFLIRPYYTLAVQDPRELLDLVIFLIVAVTAGQLAAYARQQTDAARSYADQQNILHKLSSAFNTLTTAQEVYHTLRQVIAQDLGATQVAILPNLTLPPGPPDPSEAESQTTYLLLKTGSNIYGTLHTTFARPLTETGSRLLNACAVQAAMALQRIQLVERAQHSRTLEEADRLKTALLHAVSHDLRTPLTIIKTSASNLRTLHGQLTPEQEQEMVRVIEQETDSLNRLVGNLLDMSRLKAGALAIHKDWYALSEVAGDVAAQTWQRLRAERIRLQFADDLPLVSYDYGLMRQALGNVVENVLRYEPPGSQVEIRGECAAGQARLVVVNHGPNIPDTEKELIMEPFYHGRDGQIGLGLAISQGILEAHYGRIWVEDTPGGGATFILALPVTTTGEPEHVNPGG